MSVPVPSAEVDLSPDELRRYGRQMVLPEVGREGQEKLKNASVLLVGAGGLGAPAALYLAAAGVGRLGLVDFDCVERSNLQRQILYDTDDIGRPKLEAARERILALNPHVEVTLHDTHLTSDSALDIIDGYDVVADGTDNFPTRYLVNDACVLTGTPNVYASVLRFEGQISIFAAEGGPCYRCIYEEPPPPGQAPSCAEAGVLGVLPGLLGTLQATEALKLFLGTGDPLVGRLLRVDALGISFRTLTIDRNSTCPVCGEDPTQTELIDYEAFCGHNSSPPPSDAMSVPAVTVQDLQARREEGTAPFVLDVRKPPEAEIAGLGADQLIPLQELAGRLDELRASPDEEIIVHCRTGGRSEKAAQFLCDRGFDAKNLAGGIHAWSEEIDPAVPKY